MTVLNIKVIPGARKSSITQEEGRLKVHLTAPAVDGKANEALIIALANHFKVRKSAIHIIRGLHSKEKVIQIDD